MPLLVPFFLILIAACVCVDCGGKDLIVGRRRRCERPADCRGKAGRLDGCPAKSRIATARRRIEKLNRRQSRKRAPA